MNRGMNEIQLPEEEESVAGEAVSILSSSEQPPSFSNSTYEAPPVAVAVVVHDHHHGNSLSSSHAATPAKVEALNHLDDSIEMIPPEGDEKGISSASQDDEEEGRNNINNPNSTVSEARNEEDDESEYSYSYEDEEDGDYDDFLVSTGSYDTRNGTRTAVVEELSELNGPSVKTVDVTHDNRNQNIVEDDRLNNSLSEDHDMIQFASLEDITRTSSSVASSYSMTKDPSSSNISTGEMKSKWKEPTKEAVNMSLRAEKEKSGGRRRLAADLYKVMMTDTEEAGFSVTQSSDECMDKWAIKLFKFDEDSNLHKDLLVLGLDSVELEMNFPEQYPFEPPFVRVVRPRFKKQTGFVMNGALCMELLTNEGWNPINDIESVIVSIRSLLVVGDGRLEAAANMPEAKREQLLAAAVAKKQEEEKDIAAGYKRKREDGEKDDSMNVNDAANTYSAAEAKAAYKHLSDYHKKKGWSGWWAKNG